MGSQDQEGTQDGGREKQEVDPSLEWCVDMVEPAHKPKPHVKLTSSFSLLISLCPPSSIGHFLGTPSILPLTFSLSFLFQPPSLPPSLSPHTFIPLLSHLLFLPLGLNHSPPATSRLISAPHQLSLSSPPLPDAHPSTSWSFL